jgi:hypothetical protein
MSAMPARVTEALPGADASSVAVRTPVTRSQRRSERRAEMMVARRTRRRWSIFSCAMLVGTFALTVGILDVLH